MNVQELLAEVATAPVIKRAITNHVALNEAYDYGSAFSRGMRIELNGVTILLISGTASIDDQGQTVHVGDLRAQVRRTYDNISKLLASEGATWSAITPPSTKNARSSTKNSRWIRCQLRRESRRSCAVRICSWRLKR